MSQKPSRDSNQQIPSEDFLHDAGEKLVSMVQAISTSLQRNKKAQIEEGRDRARIVSVKTDELSPKQKYEQERESILNEWEGF